MSPDHRHRAAQRSPPPTRATRTPFSTHRTAHPAARTRRACSADTAPAHRCPYARGCRCGRRPTGCGPAHVDQLDGLGRAVDADPAPPRVLGRRAGGGAPAERIQHHAALVARRPDDALQQGEGFLRGVAETLSPIPAHRFEGVYVAECALARPALGFSQAAFQFWPCCAALAPIDPAVGVRLVRHLGRIHPAPAPLGRVEPAPFLAGRPVSRARTGEVVGPVATASSRCRQTRSIARCNRRRTASEHRPKGTGQIWKRTKACHGPDRSVAFRAAVAVAALPDDVLPEIPVP